ncbi:MAG TPA: N-acetylmannosamine kinase [Burkholderiaceae bacterium]|nr:N-acetylmannosamine kinase [Rhodoferax sp.]HNW00454.1 N-acetylmannosamine kinase [Burkholderiaceae bacterium]MBP6492632.1 N-acetylmannosamine kinase [Rhodoferax sp.]MBP7572349.1 N-acetylmannosamine kinase [Rhodoferax sp.]HOZ64973.1 N-acetylmannosamine kinase [Burkholderiaceae bacterium]
MILAIDIGGTKIAAANVINGECQDRRQLPMPATEAAFLQAIQELASDRPQPTGVAIAVTGYVDGCAVRAVNPQTIPFWDAYPLIPRLTQLLGCSVVAINDAQAAAWGEYCLRHQQCQDLLFITLSTGVGGGLVLGGSLREGTHGLAGHVGHAAVDVAPIDAPYACGCGRMGCLEAVASGTALARQAGHHFGHSLSSTELFDMARLGDHDALQLVQRAARAVASAIASSHAQLDLELVVLGGSVGLAPGMLDWVQAALAEFPQVYQLPIERALLGADSGLVGAAAWLEQKVKSE